MNKLTNEEKANLLLVAVEAINKSNKKDNIHKYSDDLDLFGGLRDEKE